MADNLSMQMPTPPSTPNVAEMHRYILSLSNWLKLLHLTGLQVTQLDSVQFSGLTGLENVGKLYFVIDTTPQHLYCGYDNSGSLGLQEIF